MEALLIIAGIVCVAGSLGFVTWDIRARSHKSASVLAVALVTVSLCGGLLLIAGGAGLLVFAPE